jgi:hypothetical protein
MEWVWHLLHSGPVDPFGFSWRFAFSLQNPRFNVLDFLGFPWILSCESLFFKELRGINRKNIFNSLLAAFKAAGDGILQCWRVDGQDLSWGKLSLDSDFQQDNFIRISAFA